MEERLTCDRAAEHHLQRGDRELCVGGSLGRLCLQEHSLGLFHCELRSMSAVVVLLGCGAGLTEQVEDGVGDCDTYR